MTNDLSEFAIVTETGFHRDNGKVYPQLLRVVFCPSRAFHQAPCLQSLAVRSQPPKPKWGRVFREESQPAPELALLGCKMMGHIMETSSHGICLWVHIAMVTEHGLFKVNDLVTAFICALSYCAEVIYNLMEESPRRAVLFCLIVLCERREILPPRKGKRRERKKKI